MKKILENKKAITLIALVITIVVLVILAGVIISISLGNDGLIARALKSAKEYKNAEERDKTSINDLYGQLSIAADGTINGLTVDDLKSIIDERVAEQTQDMQGKILIDEDEYNNLNLINKPNLWQANTKEYDFGNGVYGRRFTGTIKVSTRSTRADIVLFNGPVGTILNAGGCVNYTNGNSGKGLYLGYGIQTYQNDNGYYCGVFCDGSGKVTLSLTTCINITYPANLPYDVWITYTK